MAYADAPPKELPTEFTSALAALKHLLALSLWRAKVNSSNAAWSCISAEKSPKAKIQITEKHFCKWREDSIAAIRDIRVGLPMYDELAKAHAELIEGDPLHWIESQVWDRLESMCGAQRLSDMRLRPISRNVVWWFAVATQGNNKVNLHKPEKPWTAPRWLARNRKESDWLLRLRASDLSMRFHGVIDEELMKARLQRGIERPRTVLPTSDAQLAARATGQSSSPAVASTSRSILPAQAADESERRAALIKKVSQPDRYITIRTDEAAEYFECGKRTIHRWVRNGKLKAGEKLGTITIRSIVKLRNKRIPKSIKSK